MRAALLLAAGAVGLATIHTDEFAWSRTLSAPAGAGPIAFDADAPLFAHAGAAFAGLRIVDARGGQVAWRELPAEPAPAPVRVPLLDRGRSAGAAVALLDLGAHAGVHDRLDLALPGQDFVGTVTVSGSDDRRTFTRLGSTRVFDLAGAGGTARSTAVSFPPSDFRYLRLRATGVASIDGATVSARSRAPAEQPVAARIRGRVIDLGGANVPVDSLAISATTSRYDRRVRVEARNPGGPWVLVTRARVFRLYGTPSPPLALEVRARWLRVTIENGDDPPLVGLTLRPGARPRTILAEGGHAPPLRVLYGGRSRDAPSYEFARLPRGTLDLDRLRHGTLGPVQANAAFRQAPDTRSWVKRHPAALALALALAAAAVGVAGFLAIRRT